MRHLLCLLIPIFLLPRAVWADVAVLTQHNDLNRSGANLNEVVLNITNVNANTFGMLFSRTVDDQIYAQPLIVTNVDLGTNGNHNLVIVATVNDSVYAFDADNPASTNAYWQRTFLSSNVVPVNNSDLVAAGNTCGVTSANISGNIGIIGTPVIDPVSGVLYVLARTRETSNVGTNLVTNFVQRLHALNLTNGAEQPYSPAVISLSVPGTNYYDGTATNYDSTVDGQVVFNNLQQNQRTALTLVNGVVYVCWGSHCDYDPYHGWLAGFNETNLQLVSVYNASPDGEEGSIWMSGQAPAADASGNLYISVANGTVGSGGTNANLIPTDVVNRGNSFVKLTPGGANLTVTSWFTPHNYFTMNQNDWDLGSAGLLLIPNTSLAFSGGKQGMLYLVNRDNMGGVSTGSADTNILQSWSIADAQGNDKIYGAPVWWDGPNGSYAYVWAGFNDHLRQYPFDRTNQLFDTNALIQSAAASPNGHPGGILSVSANGTNAGTGILWASLPNDPSNDAEHTTVSGILRAYNAADVSQELWDSEQNAARDAVPTFGKFVPPTVANGKVYLATFSGSLVVYGLLTPPQLSVRPGNLGFGPVVAGQTNTLTFQLVNLGGSNLTGTVTAPAPFEVLGGSPFNLASGVSGFIQIAFSPANSGSFSNNVIFTSNGGNSTNAVFGSGTSGQPLAALPVSLNFGTVAVSNTAQANFTVANMDGSVLTNGKADVNGGPFAILSGSRFNLAGFESTNVTVSFTPTNAGSFSNDLVFSTANGGNSTNTVIGIGAWPPAANFSGAPTAGTWPLVVVFTNTSTGAFTNAIWNFGDGGNTNTLGGSVAYDYLAPGTNTVTLTVSGPVGTNSLSRNNYIVVTNLSPVTITIMWSGNQLQLTWPQGTLQSANQATSAYADMTNTSPYLVTPSNTAQFYRVRVR